MNCNLPQSKVRGFKKELLPKQQWLQRESPKTIKAFS